MQQLVVEKDQRNAEKFLSSFSNLVRQTLENATELYIPINEEIKFLTSYFELERIRLEDRFSYVINTGNIQDNDKIAVPNMVIQPFIENAIKHGIRYKKDGPGFVKVDFYRDRDLLCCTVEDNGIGRKKAEQIRKELGVSHISRGISITSKRIESLNALTGGKISVIIQDLTNNNDDAMGTKVIIEFLQQNNAHDQNNNN
jgi:LytS/YehU family sensor histidine kinase